jgi:hypothetical protein
MNFADVYTFVHRVSLMGFSILLFCSYCLFMFSLGSADLLRELDITCWLIEGMLITKRSMRY